MDNISRSVKFFQILLCFVCCVFVFSNFVLCEEKKPVLDQTVSEEQRFDDIKKCMLNIRFLQRYIENARRFGLVYPKDLKEIREIPFCEVLEKMPVCPVCGEPYQYSSNKDVKNPKYSISCPCPIAHDVISISGKQRERATVIFPPGYEEKQRQLNRNKLKGIGNSSGARAATTVNVLE